MFRCFEFYKITLTRQDKTKSITTKQYLLFMLYLIMLEKIRLINFNKLSYKKILTKKSSKNLVAYIHYLKNKLIRLSLTV
jgi:hypothetical protein